MKSLLVPFSLLVTLGCSAQKNIPQVVKDAFASKFPNVVVTKWDKEDNDFEANFSKDAKTMSATFDAKGIWLETETDISVKELPATIVSYMEEHYKGEKIKEAAIIVTSKAEMYEVEVKDKDVLFDTSGKFLKVEETEED